MTDSASPAYKIANLFLFDTCTYKCGYCFFAESGRVLDSSQLKPYRDPAFVEKITGFFCRRTDDRQKWLITLTGGEPLLMPNLDLLCRGLCEGTGNKMAFYTALMLRPSHHAFRLLLEEGPAWTDYLMVSFHKEAEEFEDDFFAHLALLKRAGHHVFCRFVGHPTRLGRMEQLAEKCEKIDVSFYPTPLFSPEHPAGYSQEERAQLASYMGTMSQLIQLAGGVDTTNTFCTAGSEDIFVDVRSGHISPCVSVGQPRLGNIFEDRFTPLRKPTRCPQAGISCACDIHFQQHVVLGADDRPFFQQQKQGYVDPGTVREKLEQRMAALKIPFSTQVIKIGQTAHYEEPALANQQVKDIYLRNKTYLENGLREEFHPEFRRRQTG